MVDDFQSIIVCPGKPVIVKENPTSYPLIGRGLQGAVFRLSRKCCVKIYSKTKYYLREREVLIKVGQESDIFPNVYESGPKYIVMEYLTGPSLEDCLENTESISDSLTKEIIFLINELTRIKFLRIDFSFRHTIFDQHGNLKIIDHVNSLKVKRRYPKRLLKDLENMGLRGSFLEKVKRLAPELYQKWERYL
jgi:RIO-like serine/threonine protein kinase